MKKDHAEELKCFLAFLASLVIIGAVMYRTVWETEADKREYRQYQFEKKFNEPAFLKGR